MPSNWLSFVPQLTAQDLLLHLGTDPIGREQRLDGVALFADVSGFTAISEALGKSGKSGTEELTGILNSYFEPMINLITSYGGIIGKFGGDAMTVIFPYTPHSQAAAVQRAIQCALDMQANMHRYEAIPTSAGTFRLTMKAGLALGSVLWTSVGDPAIRLEYIIAGEVLDHCADAEHHAGQGEVVIHHALLACTDGATIKPAGEHFHSITSLPALPSKAPLPAIRHIPPDAIDTLASYLHPAIAGRLHADQTGFINEHRKVTVMFVRFDGFDYDHDPHVCASLQAYLASVIRIIHRYDGYLNKVDMGDKGSKLVVLFGAPVAHENDEERAMRCALELQHLPQTTRIGINTGYVYCGQVGSHIRQEYTVMGDVVNLAARLMQAAQTQQILVSSFARSPVSNRFAWDTLEPITVKGKRDPIKVYALKGMQEQKTVLLHESTYQLRMVGRADELQIARARMQLAQQGKGQILGVMGEAGMGKSRLSAEIIRLGRELGLTIYGGECQSYGTNISYLVWHNIWRAFFSIDSTVTLHTQFEQLQTTLAGINPKFAGRLPLLGGVLNMLIPDNDLTRALDAQGRIDLLFSLLLDVIRHRVGAHGGAPNTPLMIVLEDCHWIDPLSQSLLDFIGRNIADLPVFLLLVYRPPQDHRSPTSQLNNLIHFSEIALKELPQDEAEQLVILKLESLFGRQMDVPLELVERIITKAEHNPFYIEEIINFLRDQSIDPGSTASWQAVDLPESLHTLMMSRIDQLSEEQKVTLKVASVIGRVFRANWVWGTNPSLGDLDTVVHHLNNLNRLDIVLLDAPDPTPEYMFKHAITQEVAYQSLAFSLRESLHEQVALFIERTYAGELYSYIDVLAYHYGSSANTEKQILYFQQAADTAKAAYANETALDYYTKLLPLLDEKAQISILLNTGEVWQLMGKWAEAEAAYRQAMTHAEATQDSPALARCQSALGYLLSYTGLYNEALNRLHDARQRFETLKDYKGLAAVLEYLSFVYLQQHRYEEAITCSNRNQELAAAVEDRQSMSAALRNIGIVYFRLEDYPRALNYLAQALEIAESIQNRQHIIYSAGSLAAVYMTRGDYPPALEWSQRALDVAREIGYLRTEGVIIGNMGEVYRMCGSNEQALACYQHALQMAVELGDLEPMWTTVRNIAKVHVAQADFEQAAQWYQRAVRLGKTLNITDLLADDLFDLAELHFQQKRYAEARAKNNEAQSIAQQDSLPQLQLQTRLLGLHIDVALGELSSVDATQTIDELLADCRDDESFAMLYYEKWRFNPQDDDARYKSAERYRRLNAVAPNLTYQERYTALTGETLTQPPQLPADMPLPYPDDLNDLIAQVDATITAR